ncbi:hypothetical protein BHM03_00023482 [Ensete ventricosum]|nr:hypothetical protein BHM03_00023482 [Ensete ventricosum]
MFIVRYGRYISVRQVAGTRTARYRTVPPKIDRWRSIEGRNRPSAPSLPAGRGRSFSREGGRSRRRLVCGRWSVRGYPKVTETWGYGALKLSLQHGKNISVEG